MNGALATAVSIGLIRCIHELDRYESAFLYKKSAIRWNRCLHDLLADPTELDAELVQLIIDFVVNHRVYYFTAKFDIGDSLFAGNAAFATYLAEQFMLEPTLFPMLLLFKEMYKVFSRH
jgi:hypothetical protein